MVGLQYKALIFRYMVYHIQNKQVFSSNFCAILHIAIWFTIYYNVIAKTQLIIYKRKEGQKNENSQHANHRQ